MLKRIKEFILDFQEFRRIRRLNRTVELKPIHKNLLYSYDKDKEIELNALILGRLSEMMLAQDISSEYYRWFRAALSQRISFLWLTKTKFPIINE